MRLLTAAMAAATFRFPGEDMYQLPWVGGSPITCFFMQSRLVFDPQAENKLAPDCSHVVQEL